MCVTCGVYVVCGQHAHVLWPMFASDVVYAYASDVVHPPPRVSPSCGFIREVAPILLRLGNNVEEGGGGISCNDDACADSFLINFF